MSASPDRSERSWTDAQRRAITTRDVSVSLSAGAGCGKTFVLTERYLGYFRACDPTALQPEDLHRLVAITFTERAAREMRDRIRARCYEALDSARADDVSYWSAVLRGLDSARISTIHSFCASLLRAHAVEAGLDPQFDVLEQSQAEALLSESVDDELRHLVAQRDPAVIELAAALDLHGLQQRVRRLAVEARDDQLDTWPTDGVSHQLQVWSDYFKQQVVPLVHRLIAEMPELRRIATILRDHEPSNKRMQQRRDVLLRTLPRLDSRDVTADALAADLQTIREHATVQHGGGAKAWSDEDVYATLRDDAKVVRSRIDELSAVLEFTLEAARHASQCGLELLAIAGKVRGRYAQRKRDLAALDFDDLLARARSLMIDPNNEALRRQQAAQIDLLLVDEFQDTDRVQLDLVKALCDQMITDGKLFFVGDYKQSIYRFRGAEPDVFRELREAIPPSGQLALSKNFRSQPAILEFVNALFWGELGPDYDPLRAHREQVTTKPVVEFLWAPAPSGTSEKSVQSNRRREADWVARRVRNMLDSGEQLVAEPDPNHPGQQRPRAVRPGDIAILFRALSDVELYEDALRRYGVDYYLVGGHAFYAQQEVFDLLNLLRAIASPSDGVSLAGALRSPMFALTDETLFWLAEHNGGLTAGLFDGQFPEPVTGEQRRRVEHAAKTLRQLRASKDRLRVCQLIERAMTLTGYDAALLGEFLGERKLANLRKVIEQARSFERGGSFGLIDFIAELAEYVESQPKEPLAATLSEDTDIVRLMTVHQAKGLEFPIVIVADTDRKRNDNAPPVHFDDTLGPLVNMPDDAGERCVGGFELWRTIARQHDLDELHRLLYVAATRAADYLILSGGVTSLGDAKGTWMKLLERRFDLMTGEFVADLPAGEPRPQVRVTTEEPSGPKGARTSRGSLRKLLDEIPTPRDLPPTTIRGIEPVPVDPAALRQYSFSRLNGRLCEPIVPGEASQQQVSDIDPIDLGKLVHGVLAMIDFAAPGDWRSRLQLVAERQSTAIDSTEVRDAEQMIERFLGSSRAADIAAAQETFREAEFLLAWPPDRADNPEFLLSGYMDLLYRDARDRWCLLDFKTNRVSASKVATVAANYEMQMLVYGLAAEAILREPPGELALHFLRGGFEHRFAWDDAARRRAAELLEQAVAADRAALV